MKKIEKPIEKTYGCINPVYAAAAVPKLGAQIISYILESFCGKAVAFYRFQALFVYYFSMHHGLSPYVYLHK